MAYIGTPLLYLVIGYLVTSLMTMEYIGGIVNAVGLVSGPSASSGEKEELVSISDITGGVLDGDDVHFPSFGDNLGNFTMTGEDGNYIECPIYFGDDADQLKNGVGVYFGSSPPGFGSTVLVAGHNHTWFKPLRNAAVGDTVTISTYYGVYVYKITDIAVKKTNDDTHYDLLADSENLVMYTCYPFGSIGITPERYFVYGEYVSGPMINTGVSK